MRIIRDGRRVPKAHLRKIAFVGWIGVLYLAWVVGVDSWERTTFSFQAMSGALPELDPFNQRYVEHPLLTLFHTIPGLLFAVLGPTQFMGVIRRRAPMVHRMSGRVFLVIGITAGLAALFITLRFPIWGMSLNTLIAVGFAAFMVFAFVHAFRHVKARRFAVHREWMIRGFAAGLSVAFFRVVFSDVFPKMGIESFDARWNILMVISWPIVLGVAELWIRATRPKAAARVAPATADEPRPSLA
jgi:uncharacterized membrane protein